MKEQDRHPKDSLAGEEVMSASTGVAGAAMATAGAAVGGVSAIAAGATAGSAAGPIGAAIGGVIGALIGVRLEHKAGDRSNPERLSTGAREPRAAQSSGQHPPRAEQINIQELSIRQQQALFDLVVLAMYADGHIASAEEKRVYRLLDLLGHRSEYDRSRVYDASVVRAREHLSSPERAATHAGELLREFSSPGEKELAREVLQDFLGSDGSIGPEETNILSATR